MFTEEQLLSKAQSELFSIILNQEKIIDKNEKEIKTLKKRLSYLLERLGLMRHEKFGKKSERLPNEPEEAKAFDEATEVEDPTGITNADEEITVASYTRKKPGRKPLPKILPRVEKIYDLSEEEKTCHCGHPLTCIGDVRSEQLEIIPATMYIITHIRKKYACKACQEGVKQATLPAQPIPKSIAAPGLLAHILVSKYQDHSVPRTRKRSCL